MTILAKLYQRQGIPLETDADWAKYESHKVERRAQNVSNARQVLFRNAIAFDELGHRVGTDQLVAFQVYKPSALNCEPDSILAFFPEIGKWHDEKGDIHFGVRNLARYIIGERL